MTLLVFPKQHNSETKQTIAYEQSRSNVRQYIQSDMEFRFPNLFSKIASAIQGIQNLIIKQREVQSKSKPDQMCRSQLSVCNILHKQTYIQ